MAFTMTPTVEYKNRREIATDVAKRYEAFMWDFKTDSQRINYVMDLLEFHGVCEACNIIIAGCPLMNDDGELVPFNGH